MPLDAQQSSQSAQVPFEQPESQAILTPLTTSAAFLVVTVCEDHAACARVVDTVSDIGALVRAVGFREPTADLSCVVGIGSHLWDRIRPTGAPRPAQLHPFRPVTGARHDAPSTPGDILFHIRANRADLVFEFTRVLMDALGEDVHVEDHVTGLRYFDSRDLLGFVDGTENPTGRGAASAAVISSLQEPDFAGGSYVMVQKYLHDMAAWAALSTEEQERVIGRTKLEDIELDEEVMPTNSHVSLNTIVDEGGNERDILRDNMAFGDPSRGEMGTYYIAYASDPSVTEQMLDNMFIGNPQGNYDRILDVSDAVTGSQYFVPALDMLESLAEEMPTVTAAHAPSDSATPSPADTQEGTASAQPADTPTTPPTESLSIGSLRGRRS